MKLARLLLSWSLVAGLGFSTLVATSPSYALDQADAEENIVLLDDAAYTDTPRIGAMPDTGAELNPWLISLTGVLTASLVYFAVAGHQRRISKQ